MKRGSGVVIFIVILHLAGLGHSIGAVQNGVLDLHSHNWQKDGIVNVSGNWEFYWNKFYSPGFFTDSAATYTRSYAFVPDFWNKYITTGQFSHSGFGYATYRVKILCPPSTEPLALKFLTVQGAYRLFVNGKKLAETGRADTIEKRARAQLRPAIIKVQPENNMLDIVIQVCNFNDHEGGLWDNVKIGTEEQVEAYTTRNLSIAFIIAGVFQLAFIYNLVQFLYFRKRYVFLFFAILCLIIFIRILVTDEIPINYLFNYGWRAVRRTEFVSYYFSVPAMALFSYFLFPEDFSRKALYIILPLSAVFIVISLFGTHYAYTYVVRYYQSFLMLAAFYGLYVSIRAATKKRPGSFLFLIGYTIVLVTIINDVLYGNLIVNTVPLFYAGLVFFVLNLSVILSRQFAHTFADLEKANKQLAEANKSLGVMNDHIREKNTELEKINHELDIFVHRTSHDLRAPLSSVTGITSLMENETDIPLLHEYAVLQKKTLQRMDDLIKDIIDFSKNHRLALTFEEISFANVVTNSLEDHSHVENAVEINKQVKVSQHEKFISDAKRISTIINNLISNAIKYADFSKPEPRVGINITVANNSARIDVSDNGIGIEKSQLAKIFTMFYRATSSATGSGLGLYITKETVEKLKGKIIIHSIKGEGTTVSVVIPGKA